MSILMNQLLERLRAHEREAPYHLLRSSAESVGAVADWLLHYTDDQGDRVWRADAERRLFAAALLRLRTVFRREQIERGGGR